MRGYHQKKTPQPRPEKQALVPVLQIAVAGYRALRIRRNKVDMDSKDRDELLIKWQTLGLSLIMLSDTPEEFYALAKQEFGYIWDGEGWVKEVSYH